MQGGGILKRNYSRDHLATGGVTLTSHVDDRSKRWLASGFNAFSQLVTFEDKRKLKGFEEFKTCFQPLILSCSWSYLAAANDCSLQLQGFIFNCPKNVKTIRTDTAIKSLAANDRFVLVLLDSGKLYKLLMQQSPTELEEIKFQENQNPMHALKRSKCSHKSEDKSDLKIDFVACGNNIMVAIGNSNEVFSGTTQIHQFPKHIPLKQLVCGFEHALLLTSSGDVYSWGNGLRGQLGQEVLKVEERPFLLEALAGIKITYITSSGWHSAAVSAFGDLYTWGFNSNGQLGLRIFKNEDYTLKEPTVYPLPQLVDLPICFCSQNADKNSSFEQNCIPIKVVAGARHTVLIMNCGSIYASGWNAYGQIGVRTNRSFCDTFQYVLKVEQTNAGAIEIICGVWCTLIGINQKF